MQRYAFALAVALCAVSCATKKAETPPPAPAAKPAGPAKPVEAPPVPEVKVNFENLPGWPKAGEVQSTTSGLQYFVIAPGDGPVPETGKPVFVHYSGYLADGTKFDSSVDRGRIFSFPVGQGRVIKGWDEGIALMKVGAKYKLVIPWNLAYGEHGRPPKIPAKSPLIFDVEMFAPPQLDMKKLPGDSVTGEPTVTPTGLKYFQLKPGKGAAAKAGDQVEVHYTGWLVDGTKFDSSLDRGDKFAFPLGQHNVIAGWDEGVAGMKPGSKRKLIVPPNLGYGSRGAGAAIPPESTLIFDVEYFGVAKAEAPPKGPAKPSKKKK